MKSGLRRSLAAIVLFTCAGCKLQIPETVSVKTKASYNFCIGDFNYDLSEMFSPADLISTEYMPEGFEIYDYYPTGADDRENVQQFLVTMAVTEIPVNFSEYFEKTDLSSQISGMNYSQDFTVPSAINSNEEKTLDLDTIENALNTGVSILGVIGDNGAFDDISFAGAAAGVSFDSISYVSGAMKISAAVPDGKTATIKYTGNGLEPSWSKSGTFSGGICQIDISGKSIYETGMKISFNYGTGTPYTGVITSDSKISVAKNVTLDSSNPNAPKLEIQVDEITIPNSANQSYHSCVIGTGSSLNADVVMDPSWSFSGLKYQILTSGGLTITETDCPMDASSKNISLEDKEIIPEDIVVKPKIEMELNNSTINFAKPPKITVTTNIGSFKSLTASFENADSFRFNKKQELPAGMTNYIEKILFDECGLKGTYKNTFPAGNDITIKSTCGFFFGEQPDGSDKEMTGVLVANTTTSTSIAITELNRTVLFGGDDGYSDIDFTARLLLPGQISAESTLFTLSNIVPSQTYSLEIELEPCLDWNSISFKTESQKDKVSTGLNLAAIFNEFDSSSEGLSNLTLVKLPVYLYFERPEIPILNDATFKGSLKALYYQEVESGETTTVNPIADSAEVEILSGQPGSDSMNFVNMPALNATKLKTDSVLETTTVNLDAEECSVSCDLAPLSKAQKLPEGSVVYIEYDLKLTNGNSGTSFTVNHSDLGSATDVVIGIRAAIDLPLELEVTKEINLDLLKWLNMDSTTDLLGRTEATVDESVDEIMSLVKAVGVKYTMNEMPFKSSQEMQLLVNLGNEEKTYGMESGFVGIERDTLRYIMKTYPFSPTINLIIPDKTIFSMPRNMGIDINLILNIETDGTVQLYEKNGGGL